jgi:hypothetical protein
MPEPARPGPIDAILVSADNLPDVEAWLRTAVRIDPGDMLVRLPGGSIATYTPKRNTSEKPA